jgi:hypothetical protein
LKGKGKKERCIKMVHSIPDFKTAKELKEHFKNGKRIEVYDPAGIFPLKPAGIAVIEGPARYHKFYIRVEYVDYMVTKILR